MSQDKYISELDEKTSSGITGSYVFVIQSPGGKANSTYKITVSEIVNWIQSNTNYTEIYSLPIEEVPVVGDTKITVIGDDGDSPVGSPIPRTEAIRIKALNKNVGLKTIDPQSSLEVWSSDSVNGDIMITPESGDRMGFHVTASDDAASPTVPAILHLGKKIYGEDSVFVPLISIEETGNTTIGTNDPNSITTIEGFSRLGGAAAPEIKMIVLTGTTGTIGASPVNSIVSIPHGLNYEKIISCNILVKDSANSWIGPNDRYFEDKMFSFTIDDTDVNILLDDDSPSRSSDLQSSQFVCTLTYTN